MSFTSLCRARSCRWVVVRRSKYEACRSRQGAARSSKVTGGAPMPFAGTYRVFPSGNIVKISTAAGLFFLFVSRFDKGLGRLRRMGSEPVSPHRRLSWPLSQAAGESEEDTLCRARSRLPRHRRASADRAGRGIGLRPGAVAGPARRRAAAPCRRRAAPSTRSWALVSGSSEKACWVGCYRSLWPAKPCGPVMSSSATFCVAVASGSRLRTWACPQ